MKFIDAIYIVSAIVVFFLLIYSAYLEGVETGYGQGYDDGFYYAKDFYDTPFEGGDYVKAGYVVNVSYIGNDVPFYLNGSSGIRLADGRTAYIQLTFVK